MVVRVVKRTVARETVKNPGLHIEHVTLKVIVSVRLLCFDVYQYISF